MMPMPKENKKYTYADLLTWPIDEKWEIIDGTPYVQAAPTWQHQAILIELASQQIWPPGYIHGGR